MLAVHLQICTGVVHRSQARGTAVYVCLAGETACPRHHHGQTLQRPSPGDTEAEEKTRLACLFAALAPAPPPCRAVALGERVDLATCQLITHLRRSNLHPNLHTPHKLAKSRYLQPSPSPLAYLICHLSPPVLLHSAHLLHQHLQTSQLLALSWHRTTFPAILRLPAPRWASNAHR